MKDLKEMKEFSFFITKYYFFKKVIMFRDFPLKFCPAGASCPQKIMFAE